MKILSTVPQPAPAGAPHLNMQGAVAMTARVVPRKGEEFWVCNPMDELIEAMEAGEKFVAHRILAMQPKRVIINPDDITRIEEGMSRHEIVNEKGKWCFGWDQPLQTFYLQCYNDDLPEDENPVVWLGATPPTVLYEIDDLYAAARINGLKIPREMQATLYEDKDYGR